MADWVEVYVSLDGGLPRRVGEVPLDVWERGGTIPIPAVNQLAWGEVHPKVFRPIPWRYYVQGWFAWAARAVAMVRL